MLISQQVTHNDTEYSCATFKMKANTSKITIFSIKTNIDFINDGKSPKKTTNVSKRCFSGGFTQYE